MKFKKQARKFSFIAFSLMMTSMMGCGGSSTGSSDSGSSGGGTTTAAGSTVTLSGQAAVAASDLTSSLSVGPAMLALTNRPKFATTADTALTNATVTLFKMEADGTEEQVDVGTITTDASGNYTIPSVPVATGGTGATTDFYYEVRVTSSDLTVIAPAAPEANTTVNVSPESHLAAKMLTDVENVSGNVIPRQETIENLRNLVSEEVATEAGDNSITLPPLSGTDSVQIIAATAIGSNGGNSERALRTFEAEKEQLKLESSTDTDDVGAYLESVARQGCNFNSNFNFPESARDAIANAFIADATVTPSELITAFNANNGSGTDTTVGAEVTEIDTLLGELDTSFEDKTAIDSTNDIGLYVKRDLAADSFSESTELELDQAVAFTQGLFTTPCQPGSFDFIGFVSDLTGEDIAATPSIVDRQIYHDSGFGCSNGQQGHTRAEVQVYAAGGATVNGVSITKGSSTVSLNSNGQNGAFSRWTLSTSESDTQTNTAFYCMTLPSDVSYTITVDLQGATDITETVTAEHRSVPEANISFVDSDGTATQLQNGQVAVTNAKRPIFKWSPTPGTPDSTVIADAPEGSQIKFTFELSYIDTSSQQQSPLNNAACPTGGSGNKLLDRNYFVADTDCDIPTCATASGISESNIACRTNIQTYLVDENDRFLGQAAGNFRMYCYDSNDDGDCGN